MRRYAQVSGTFFAVIAGAHLARAVMGLSLQVADVTVPAWASVGAFAITGGLSLWAFRTATRAA